MGLNNSSISKTQSTVDDYASNTHVKPTEELIFSRSLLGHRNSAIYNNSNDNTTHENTLRDPDGILASLPWLECIFCNKYKTAIDFDMELHLYEKHRLELLRQFPIKAKGYSMDLRAEYFVHQIKITGEKLEQIKEIQATLILRN